MKKTLCILLCCIICFAASACDSSGDVTAEKPAREMYDTLAEFYKTETVTDYRVAAALFHGKSDMTAYRFDPGLPGTTVTEICDYLLFIKFLQLGGLPVEEHNTVYPLEKLKEVVDGETELSVDELANIVYVYSLYGIEFDKAKMAKDIESRQGKLSAGFTEYVVVGSETYTVTALATAHAYNALTVLKSVADVEIRDAALVFMGEMINNNNTLSDIAGKESSVATAEALISMLSSGIPLDGEISTALLNACKTFKIEHNGVFAGYSEYNGSEASKTATGIVFLCTACAMYGNVFTVCTGAE